MVPVVLLQAMSIIGNSMKNLLPARLKFSVIFLITDRCNLRCPYCFRADSRKQGGVPLEKFRKIIRRHRPVYLQLSGGEPTLHPEFERLVRWCVRRPMITQMTVNGAGTIKRIRFFEKLAIKPITAVSLDAADETHDSIRRRLGLFAEVVELVEYLKSIRAPAAFSTVIFGPGFSDDLPEGNLGQVGPLVRLAEEMDVPIAIQPVTPSTPGLRRSLAEALESARSPNIAVSPSFIRLLENDKPGPCLYNMTHISYGADGEPLPTDPGNCYFAENCEECFYACVREPTEIFRGAMMESLGHFAKLSLKMLS